MNEVGATTDADLWVAVRGGDAAAFAELYERHSASVYNFAFRRTGSWSQAEDVTSVVFLETWRRRATTTLDGDSSLLPWLYGVTNNVIRHELRAMVRYRRMIDRLPKVLVERDPADDVVGRMHDQQRMRQVLDGMRDLTVVEKETVALCVWAGLSYADAAVAMHIPVGTVRSRLARARDRLRAHDIHWTNEHEEGAS